MTLNNLKPAAGSVKNQGKRIGRGQGSGKGGTATRGHKGAKSRLEVSQISAQLQDFLYDLNFQVTRFSFKVPGQAAIIVSGDRVNAQCKAALARASKGDQITISDIKSKVIGANIATQTAAVAIYEIQ